MDNQTQIVNRQKRSVKLSHTQALPHFKFTKLKMSFYLNSGIIGKSFYESYIKHHLSKKIQKKFEALLKDEDDYFIDYYRVGISNPDDRAWEFSSLWFFDIGLKKGYMPVFITGINTSSCLAMELCGMDRDDDEGDEIEKTLEELLEHFCPIEEAKETIRQILELKKD